MLGEASLPPTPPQVYSLGMVLLELLTGRPPALQNPHNGQATLPGCAKVE